MDESIFYGEMVAIVTAHATHPEGTVLDEHGHPVAPQED